MVNEKFKIFHLKQLFGEELVSSVKAKPPVELEIFLRKEINSFYWDSLRYL